MCMHFHLTAVPSSSSQSDCLQSTSPILCAFHIVTWLQRRQTSGFLQRSSTEAGSRSSTLEERIPPAILTNTSAEVQRAAESGRQRSSGPQSPVNRGPAGCRFQSADVQQATESGQQSWSSGPQSPVSRCPADCGVQPAEI